MVEGMSIDGDLHLQPSTALHESRETPLELLNREENFFPLSLPGVVAGTLLTFIPAAGDFINAQLLGGPQNHMIGNVIQSKFLELTDYPAAAAMSFILMAGILVFVFLYARLVGTEQLTGTAA